MFTSSGLDAVVSERSAYARTRGSRPEAPASSAVASSSGAGAHASRAASSPAFARALRSVASSGAASGSACSQMENLQRDTHMMHVNLAAALAPTAPGLPVHRPLRARRAPSPAAVPPPTAPASSTGRDCTIHDIRTCPEAGGCPLPRQANKLPSSEQHLGPPAERRLVTHSRGHCFLRNASQRNCKVDSEACCRTNNHFHVSCSKQRTCRAGSVACCRTWSSNAACSAGTPGKRCRSASSSRGSTCGGHSKPVNAVARQPVRAAAAQMSPAPPGAGMLRSCCRSSCANCGTKCCDGNSFAIECQHWWPHLPGGGGCSAHAMPLRSPPPARACDNMSKLVMCSRVSLHIIIPARFLTFQFNLCSSGFGCT